MTDLLSDAEYRTLASAWAFPDWREQHAERRVRARRLRADEPILVLPRPGMSKRDLKVARQVAARRRRRHCARVQAALGFTWDLTVVRELRLRARAEAWGLRGSEA